MPSIGLKDISGSAEPFAGLNSVQISDNSSDLSVLIPSYCSGHLNAVIKSVRALRPRKIIVVDSSPTKPEGLPDDVSLVWLG